MHAYFRLSRLHRPVGILLLMLPCWWGVAQADPQSWNFKLLALFALGSIFMRGAGCILNDLIDRDIDRQVTRTKSRPLVTGELSLHQAFVSFALHCLGGLAVLLMLPPQCWPISIIGLFLLILYPFMKRVTHWPQAVLGLAFNLGIIFAAVAITPYDSINWSAVLSLYGAGIAWSIGYDTLYAFQDKEDDLKIGVKSTAIRFGNHGQAALMVIYILMFLLLANVGYWANGKALYYSLITVAAVATLGYLRFLDITDPDACQKAFNCNPFLGGFIWIALEIL
jgi:4-hydroxybenzoate polyprenyl transferase